MNSRSKFTGYTSYSNYLASSTIQPPKKSTRPELSQSFSGITTSSSSVASARVENGITDESRVENGQTEAKDEETSSEEVVKRRKKISQVERRDAMDLEVIDPPSATSAYTPGGSSDDMLDRNRRSRSEER